jgi:hypothetical protein
VTDVDCRPAEDCLLIACEVAVRRALEVASKRMLTRGIVGTLPDVPHFLIYTHLPAVTEATKMDRLLAGAWSSLPEALTGIAGLVDALDDHVRSLLASGVTYDPEYLRPVIRRQL